MEDINHSTTEVIQEVYSKRAIDFSERQEATENKIRIISYLRVFLALAAIVSFYFAITKNTDYFYLMLFLIMIFVVLVFVHTRLFRKRDLLRNTIQINKHELKYLDQDYSLFDPGNEFIDFTHPYTFDLDIFGEGSLFQSLCRTVTYNGKQMLAKNLSNACLDSSEVLSRHESVRELKEKLDFRQSFQATGLLLNESPSDREKLKSWLKEDFHFLHNKLFPYVIYILPLVITVFLFVSIFTSHFHPGLALAVLCNWVVYGLNAKKVNHLYALVSKKKILLDRYSDLFEMANGEKFSSPELQDLKNLLQDASGQFKMLANRVGWLDQRLNIFVGPVLNSLFLYDLHWSYLIEKWRSENDKHMLLWMNTLGKLDLLCSMANLHFNHPDFCFPEIEEGSFLIQTKGIGHPLIKNNKRVPNDFEIGEAYHIAIVTGANMAGKSTFLRVVGINLVLAFAGAPVCAEKFKTSLVSLLSSMRISDSLKDDVSYFYAELQRLKTIRQMVESGKPALILLDEMLRGTNSKDKQQGSKAFIENLLGRQCLCLAATHDLMLGQLEEEHPEKIKNFCFESFLEDNELKFDYKIRPGVAKNTNASFLMKKLGII